MEVKCYWLELLETVQSTTILLLVTGDCAEHSYYDWGLETVQSH